MNEWEWGLLEEHAAIDSVSVAGVELKKGSFVRLHPRAGGDIFDLALAGRTAMVESIEQDYEGKLHLAVVLEDDPGRDLGILRQPGHRFFFTPEEVEPLRQQFKRSTRAPRILIAGIGNIFLGDDAFGVEVVRRLPQFADNVTVKDFGIRGYDLAYALLDGYDLTILVDAAPRGDAPGTLYVIEPDPESAPAAQPIIDGHAMNPVNVLRMAREMGPISGRVLLVACEPADLGGDEGRMGLSVPVSAALEEAVDLVARLVAQNVSRSDERKDGPNGIDAHGE
jgi:hydrogenase maturation protease